MTNANLQNISTEFWDARKTSYERDYLRAPIRKFATDYLFDFIKQHNPKTVLDLGSGSGTAVKDLIRKTPKTNFILLDSSEGMLETAKTHLNEFENTRFVHSSLVDLSDLNSNSIDVVISSFAMHHVPDSEKLKSLNEINRVLTKSGLACIIDEIICDPEYEDSDALFAKMRDTFYPWLSLKELEAKFLDFVEYPTNLSNFQYLCELTGFDVRSEQISEITAIIHLKPKSRTK